MYINFKIIYHLKGKEYIEFKSDLLKSIETLIDEFKEAINCTIA